MRRAHLGETYHGGSHTVEDENTHLTQGLSDKVKVVKSLAIDIGTEVREHNKFLNEMEQDFDKSGGFLGQTMKRVQLMAKAGHNRYIFYLILFSLFVFFVIWIILKFR